MIIFICSIIIAILLFLVCKARCSKGSFPANESSSEPKSSISDSCEDYYQQAQWRIHDKKYQTKILSSADIEVKISEPFVLSIEQDYDCFFLLTEQDGKIHSTDDLVFYNSDYRYYPIRNADGSISYRIEKSQQEIKGPFYACSKDGSIIYENCKSFPDYSGHRINLSLVDKRIKSVILLIGEYPFDLRKIQNFTLRMSQNMIYWAAKDYGFNDSFYFEDVFLERPCYFCEVCSFERRTDGSWKFKKESAQYQTFEEVLCKYDLRRPAWPRL